MDSNILLLTPSTAALPDVPRLEEQLRQIGLIAEPFQFNGQEHFKPGDELMRHLTFLGCSPVVALGEPGKTGEEFCHIEFYGPLAETLFISGRNVKPLRCPVCGHREPNWQPIVDAWKRDRTPWHCPSCENDISLEQIRWNKSAGFGRFFIKVWGIFESEAVPGDQLLATLKITTNCGWNYFYYRGEPF
jgi:hypothetical protein